MDKNLLKELKRFLKNNYKKTLLTGLLIAVIYTVFSVVGAYLSQGEEVPASKEVDEEEFANPGVFRFYVETQDGEMYQNITIFEEYFLLPGILRQAERSTGVEITDLLEQQELNEFEKTITNRGVLGIGRNQSSGIYTFKANLGTEKGNLKVAEFFFDYLESGEIPVLEDKNLYIVEEPYLVELTEEEAIELIPAERIDSPMRILRAIAENLILGFIFGIVVSAFGYIILAIFHRNILYSFTYNWEMNDHHLIVDKEDDLENALSLILYPGSKNKVLLAESVDLREKLTEELLKYNFVHIVNNDGAPLVDKLNIIITENFRDISPFYSVEEIVYAVRAEETTKKWYYQQRHTADHYPIQNKIIQFNK